MKIDRTYLPTFTRATAFSAANGDKDDLQMMWLAEYEKREYGVSVAASVMQTIDEATAGKWALDQWEVY